MKNISSAKEWISALLGFKQRTKSEVILSSNTANLSSTLHVDLGIDPTDDRPVFGFNFNNTFIFDPALSSCGRFKVDAAECYGISADDLNSLQLLNGELEAATEAAINAGCLSIQNALAVASGDDAGDFFSGQEIRGPFAISLGLYMLREMELAQSSRR